MSKSSLNKVDGRAEIRRCITLAPKKVEALLNDYGVQLNPADLNEKTVTDAVRVFGKQFATDLVDILDEFEGAGGKRDKGTLVSGIIGSAMQMGAGVAQAFQNSKTPTAQDLTADPVYTAAPEPAGKSIPWMWIGVAGAVLVGVVVLFYMLKKKKGGLK